MLTASSRSVLDGRWYPFRLHFSAVPAAAGGGDDEYVARPHLGLPDGPQHLDAAVRPLDAVLAGKPGRAPRHAEGAQYASVAQDGGRHGFEESDPPDSSVAAAPAPRAAGACANLVRIEAHRKAKFEHLRIGEPGVGHVGLH